MDAPTEITYEITRIDILIASAHMLLHHPGMAARRLPFLTAFGVGLPALMTQSWRVLAWDAAFTLVLSTVLFLFVVAAMIAKRIPNPRNPRICSTTLWAQGIRDISPNRVLEIPWSEIIAVQAHKGFVYFMAGFRKSYGGCYLPARAFPDVETHEAFIRKAQALWQEAQNDPWIHRTGAWPPAPLTGK